MSCNGAGRKELSCLHGSLIVREAIYHNIERGSLGYVILLDTRKAFDQVWVEGLCYQLLQLNIDMGLWKLIRNYYSCAKCSVQVKDGLSRRFDISQGVHQGAVMSLTLYCIFINNLLTELCSFDVGCHINEVFCGTGNTVSAPYADDVKHHF